MKFREPPFLRELNMIEDPKERARHGEEAIRELVKSRGFQYLVGIFQDIQGDALNMLVEGSGNPHFNSGRISAIEKVKQRLVAECLMARAVLEEYMTGEDDTEERAFRPMGDQYAG